MSVTHAWTDIETHTCVSYSHVDRHWYSHLCQLLTRGQTLILTPVSVTHTWTEINTHTFVIYSHVDIREYSPLCQLLIHVLNFILTPVSVTHMSLLFLAKGQSAWNVNNNKNQHTYNISLSYTSQATVMWQTWILAPVCVTHTSTNTNTRTCVCYSHVNKH